MVLTSARAAPQGSAHLFEHCTSRSLQREADGWNFWRAVPTRFALSDSYIAICYSLSFFCYSVLFYCHICVMLYCWFHFCWFCLFFCLICLFDCLFFPCFSLFLAPICDFLLSLVRYVFRFFAWSLLFLLRVSSFVLGGSAYLFACRLISMPVSLLIYLFVQWLVFLRWWFFCKCSTSLPGGNQVDGLPPAASSWKSAREH